jgi:hypothetical protein
MSEQEFRGLSPKSETGKSLYFFSLDNWIDLHDCIDMLITPGLPAYPMMEAEEAEYLADEMQKRLDFGIIRAYYELQAKQIFRTSHISNENESNTIPNTDSNSKERANFVEGMMYHTQNFINFLKDSGGFIAG